MDYDTQYDFCLVKTGQKMTKGKRDEYKVWIDRNAEQALRCIALAELCGVEGEIDDIGNLEVN